MQYRVRFSIDVEERESRTATVLVVSGDVEWREVVARVLGQEGYQVLGARHEGHALVVSMRHSGPIDLLISDGSQGRRQSDFPARLFLDRPRLRLLHLATRPSSRDALVSATRDALVTSSCRTPPA